MTTTIRRVAIIAVLLLSAPHRAVLCQQIPALDFTPSVGAPAFEQGRGPVVLIDEAHNNFHTLGPTIEYDDSQQKVTIPGRFGPFAKLLRGDGYVVRSNNSRFTQKALDGASVLVIANAVSEKNLEDWSLPNPSAFDTEEIAALEAWVRDGGAVLLIADHQPWPAAAASLAERFGFLFTNGSTDRLKFRRGQGSLRDHAITRGRNSSERIDSVFTFSGQAFRFALNVTGDPLMVIAENITLTLQSDPFEELTEKDPSIRADGMFQGAVVNFGAGRVAACGEAAMFTAQVFGEDNQTMGMNDSEAPQNAQFVLNVIHWLTEVLPAE